jgi:hypothetical protein
MISEHCVGINAGPMDRSIIGWIKEFFLKYQDVGKWYGPFVEAGSLVGEPIINET